MANYNDNQARLSTATTINGADQWESTAQSSSFTKTSSFSYTSSSGNGNEEQPASPQRRYGDTIPPSHPNRTLVLCFDGTGDQFDADNSNIVELFAMLKKDDPDKQLVYYQAGIGTYTTPQIATPLMAKFSQKLDMAVAWNLDAHIMGGYEFLMQNYRAGDKICIFGFSRGAYTARCLAGMVHKVGLLPACNHQQVPFAYKMYSKMDDEGWKQSNGFKKTFSIDVNIEFLGVWDTVCSVGLIPRHMPFTTSNTVVKTFRHAVSLDERRAKFKANLWNRPNAVEENLSISDKQKKKKKEGIAKAKKGAIKKLENKYGDKEDFETDIDEVWFAGCHCDIGGGSVGNGVNPSLARIPFRWMIRECFKTNSGIMFHVDGLRRAGLNPDSLYPYVTPRPPALSAGSIGQTMYIRDTPRTPEVPPPEEENLLPTEEMLETEEEAELKDALSPIYDQLSLAWFWWILELLPMKQKFQKGDNSWSAYFGWNLGRGRFIPKQKSRGVRVHRSVKIRMEAEHLNGKKYEPKANLKLENVTWVD
ncbi:hypothetical protein CPC08DRAFT_630430 [Agrocybe pediades]|nr:hypothetical protein CPC08DRAFT_630430 [Agrocybe pediades]